MSSMRFGGTALALSALMFVGLGAGRVQAQQGAAPAAPGSSTSAPLIDLKDPAVIEAGTGIFRRSCTTYCHGREGQGGGIRGPRLRNGNFDNSYLFQVISNGRAAMPAFGRVYTPEQIWQVIAYIQSMRD